MEYRQLKNKAAGNGSARKLAAFHTLVMLTVSLAVMAIDFVLEQQIQHTGGLSGMGVRPILTTAQTVLRQAQLILLPFWQIGWLWATVKLAKRNAADRADLTEGFRRFFPFLRLKIFKIVMFGVLALAAMYAAAFVVLLTPFATPLYEYMAANLETITEAELMMQMEQLMVPMLVIGAVMAVAAIAPFFYRFRMAEYVMLDHPKMRPWGAIRVSWRMMKGKMWKLLGLDVSFWWFWLLSALAAALAWADVILPAVGIALPWSAEMCYFGAFLLSAIAQLTLHYFAKAKKDVTYAHAYFALLPKKEDAYESH